MGTALAPVYEMAGAYGHGQDLSKGGSSMTLKKWDMDL